LLYVVLITSHKLHHYFDTYPIEVVTEFPLGNTLRNKDTNGCIFKWALKLSPYLLEFQSCMTIKSQALVNFIVEWTDKNTPTSNSSLEHWKMYFDGLRIHFKASNNVTEYEVAQHGLRIAIELGIKKLMVFGDSALVINQVNKDWGCTSERMDAYHAQIRKLENKFYDLEFHHVVWADNEAADKLSKLGSTQAVIPHGVFIHDLVKLSIEQEEKPMAEQPSIQTSWSLRFQAPAQTGENRSSGISPL
jgi:ribonuclease HI